MAKIDISSKRLIQIRPNDWARVIVPDCEDEWITELKTDKIPKIESRLDSLILINKPNGNSFILNIEPQGYFDRAMPARMLRYRADVWEYTMTKNMGTPTIKQVVVFFYPSHDNKQNILQDSWENEKLIDFKYDVVRVWTMKKKIVIDKKLIGLYPLLPLMEQEDNETQEDIIQNTVNIIQNVEEEALKADLFAAMCILIGEKYSIDLVNKYVRREMLMMSPLYNQWVEEERKEMAVITYRNSIIELIEEKFDVIPQSVYDKLEKVNNLNSLRVLNKKILKVETIKEFENIIDKAL